MREVAPSIAVVRVIFSDCRPLPFRSVAAPFLPVLLAFAVFLQTLLLLAEVLVVIDDNHDRILLGNAQGDLEDAQRAMRNVKVAQDITL